MGRKSTGKGKRKGGSRKPIPPGATRRASDADLRPGEPPDPIGDRHAAGTPGGGTEVGGLAGTNIGDGAPENADLDRALGTDIDAPDDTEAGPPYGGISGGAVGGTPAEGRSAGGNIERGIAPGGVHRGDSTIGADPNAG